MKRPSNELVNVDDLLPEEPVSLQNKKKKTMKNDIFVTFTIGYYEIKKLLMMFYTFGMNVIIKSTVSEILIEATDLRLFCKDMILTAVLNGEKLEGFKNNISNDEKYEIIMPVGNMIDLLTDLNLTTDSFVTIDLTYTENNFKLNFTKKISDTEHHTAFFEISNSAYTTLPKSNEMSVKNPLFNISIDTLKFSSCITSVKLLQILGKIPSSQFSMNLTCSSDHLLFKWNGNIKSTKKDKTLKYYSYSLKNNETCNTMEHFVENTENIKQNNSESNLEKNVDVAIFHNLLRYATLLSKNVSLFFFPDNPIVTIFDVGHAGSVIAIFKNKN